MKHFILRAAPALALLTACASAFADRIRVEVNGDPVQFAGVGPQEVQGRVLVPLRGVLEKLGAFVDWVPSSQTVIASRGNLDLQLRIGSRIATVNGREVTLDVPAATMGGSTMVPLRFVGETLGADVRWIAQTSTVVITTAPANANDTPNVRGAGFERRASDRDRNPAGDRRGDRGVNAAPPPIIVPRPAINRITHDRPNGWLRGGELLTVRMRGTPGAEASFRIPGVADNVKMREVAPGEYEQSWAVPTNAPLNLTDAPILGMLRAPNSDDRDASVVQAGNTVQVDNTPPTISDVNPAPKCEVSKARPLISATFTDQGGSGVAADRVRIIVDGRDVTNDASVTGQFFSYTPAQPLEGPNHRVEVTVYDRAGNQARESWEFNAPVVQNVKGIEEIRTNARGNMKPGDVINFAVRGVPGSRAVWSLGGWKNIPLKESVPGSYVGSYRLRDSDDLEKAHVTFALSAPNGRKYTETSAEELNVVVGPPDAPKVTYPIAGDKLTDPLVIRGTGAPNSIVRLKMDYTQKVLGILGVRGTASQQEIQVGPDGKWATKPLDLGSLLRSRDTQLTLSATTINARQQESPVTTLRIR